MAVPPTSAALFLSALFLLASCAGGPSAARVVTVREGSPTVTQFVNVRGGENQVFTLRNESSLEPGTQPGTQTKVIPDAVMQELLDHYAELGLFADAGHDVPASTRLAIVVSTPGQRYVLHASGGSTARRQAFGQACTLFLNIFNLTSNYRATEVQDSNVDTTKRRDAAHRPSSGGQER